MTTNNTKGTAATAALLACICFTAASPALAADEAGWDFTIAPLYLWAKNVEGTSGMGPASAPLSLDFKDDILENLDAAFSLHVEASKGDMSLFAQYNYAKLDPTVVVHEGEVLVTGDVNFEDTMWELGARFTVAETAKTQWQALLGIRGMKQELDFKINRDDSAPGILPGKISGGDEWWLPIFGGRVVTKLSDRWSFMARADVGYLDTKNRTAHAIGMFDYRFRDWGSFFAGYRYLGIDYDNERSGGNAFFFDGNHQGPVLGVNFYL